MGETWCNTCLRLWTLDFHSPLSRKLLVIKTNGFEEMYIEGSPLCAQKIYRYFITVASPCKCEILAKLQYVKKFWLKSIKPLGIYQLYKWQSLKGPNVKRFKITIKKFDYSQTITKTVKRPNLSRQTNESLTIPTEIHDKLSSSEASRIFSGTSITSSDTCQLSGGQKKGGTR